MEKPGIIGKAKVKVLPLAVTLFFVVSGGPYTAEQVVGKAGPGFGLLILVLLPLVWCLPVGLMTAELSSRFPVEGGYYVWVKTALGPFAGFLCAWWSWTSSWVDLALYPLVAVQYATHLGRIVQPQLWVYAIIAVFTVLNLFGIQSVGRFSVYIFYAILAVFGLVVCLGLKRWIVHHPTHLFVSTSSLKWDGLGAAIVLGLWNYFGWDSLTTTSGEVASAGKQFPRAILLGVFLVSCLIVLPIFAGIALKTNWSQWDNDKGYWPEIAAAGWPLLFVPIVVAGVLSNVGLFAANLLASSRIPFVLARDRYLPIWMAREHPRFNTPWIAILIGAALSAILSREGFDKLVAIDLSLYLLALLLELAALVVLRAKPDSQGGFFRIGGGRVGLSLCVATPIFVALGGLFLMLNPATKVSDLAVNPLILLAAFACSGPIVYFCSTHYRKQSVSRIG